MNHLYLMAIEKLPGGGYGITEIQAALTKLTDWVTTLGITASGVSLIIGFVLYAVVDVDQKPKVKQRIIKTLLGIACIILALSLVNLIIDLFIAG